MSSGSFDINFKLFFFTKHTYLVYIWIGFGIKWPTANDLPKLFKETYHGRIITVSRSIILLRPLFLLIKVLTRLDLSPKLLKHRNVKFFSHCHFVTPIIFKERWSNSAMFRNNDTCRALLFNAEGVQRLRVDFFFTTHLVLQVDMIIQEEVGFIRKLDILLKFLDVLQKWLLFFL